MEINSRGNPYDKLAFLLDNYAFNQWCKHNDDESTVSARFLHDVLKRAQVIMLTPTQKAYLDEYYINRLTQKMIAEKYGVGMSTVSRTMKAGLHNLAKVIECIDDRYAGLSKHFARPKGR